MGEELCISDKWRCFIPFSTDCIDCVIQTHANLPWQIMFHLNTTFACHAHLNIHSHMNSEAVATGALNKGGKGDTECTFYIFNSRMDPFQIIITAETMVYRLHGYLNKHLI